MSSTEKIRLLIVSGDLDAIKQLRQQLQAEKTVEVVGHAVAALEAIRLTAQEKPDGVCIDLEALGSEGIAICEAIAARLPDLRVVMILPHGNTDADLMRRAMRAGVRELLVRPFNAGELVESLHRAQHLEPKPDEGFEAHRQHEPEAPSTGSAKRDGGAPHVAPAAIAPEAKHGTVLTVFSAVGGIGRSTLAVNLALSLKEATKGRVALVDGDLRFGDVGILLNMRSNRSMVDVCTTPGNADVELLDSVMLSHYSGVRVLLGPLSPEFGEMVTPGALSMIIRALYERFDYVVVDTHTFLDESMLMLLDVSDKVLLLTTSELPAMKNTKLFLHVTEMLNYMPDKTLLIVNRHNPKGRITPADIESSIKHPVYAVIERDDKVTSEAAQTGQPFVLHQKAAPISQSVNRRATQLVAPPSNGTGPKRRLGLFRR